MLREITWETFQDWMIFAELEPLDRDIYQLAYIAQILVNLHRDPKTHPNVFPLTDFLLKFDSEEIVPERPQQTPEYIEAVLLAWIDGHNAQLKERGQWPGSLT